MKKNAVSNTDKLTTADLLTRLQIPREKAEAFALKLPLLTAATEPDSNGLFMALNREAATPEAKALVEAITTDVHRISGGVYGITRKMRLSVGAIIADLLHSAALGSDSYRYRSLGSDSFSDSYIGLDSYKKSLRGLETLGLLDTIIGGFSPLGGGHAGTATKVFPAPLLKAAADQHGVDLALADIHFPLAPPTSPLNNSVALKSASTKAKVTYGDKTPGKPMRVDHTHSRVMTSKDRISRLNSFFAAQSYEFCGVPTFRRVFNLGDLAGFQYDKGGRLFSYGRRNYQNLPKWKRKYVRINGTAMREIDLKASHPTIFAAKAGLTIDPTKDLYAGDGTIPRAIVKRYVLQSLGGNAPATVWDDDNLIWYASKYNGPVNSIDLQEDYPIGRVRAAAFASFPALREWAVSPLIWADLHFIESEALLDAMCILAFDYGIPALPVHDSLMVPEDHVELAATIFADCFEKYVGQRPIVELKPFNRP